MNDNDLLKAIAEGLNKTPQQFYLFLFIILFLVLLFIGFALIHSRVKKNRLLKVYKEKYEQYAADCNLTHLEIELIDKLSRFLKKPEKKYLLLVNQHTFNRCFHEYQKIMPIDTDIVKALRIKLGFKLEDLFHIPVSSRDIREGKPAVLILADKKKITGMITKQLPDSLVFTIGDNSTAPLSGSNATVYMHNSMGIYYFRTIVQNTKAANIFMMHSDAITKIQRREYYRKEMLLPIHIQKEGSREMPLSSIIINLSAGGMCVKNPQMKFKKGDDCRLFFHKEADVSFNLNGEVIRTSKNGAFLHIRFGHLSISMEDQIISFLVTIQL